MQVTGAVLPKSYDEMLTKIERIKSFSTRIQIDLCDGRMGRELTWLPEGNEELPYKDTNSYECDLMVVDWRTYMPRAISLGMKRIVAHIDSFSEADMDELVQTLEGTHVHLGLAVSNDVEVSEFDDKVRYIREKYHRIFIQVMGIREIGEQGQLFDESCIERIKHSKQMFGDLEVQVDGAMRPETAAKVLEAGATTAVVGSYLLRHDDPGAAYSELSSLEATNVCL
jgi:ribulose-phosphate 3-epimerase